jgi:hypothetical protein
VLEQGTKSRFEPCAHGWTLFEFGELVMEIIEVRVLDHGVPH